ncbi:hypothetical protein CALVIDRAFT_292403 [Calocera viscosa TUFC12733]|uniref:Methyltransferase domain-containing protein n=1 Tax=Calocera viscosa (strain TUFC12733) TaxID=1330018 RepID=A0A167ILH0_CALVF|nr:hypothetical protein CALVIDRAFT_292403 [Calocera viscosa TUFC12733]
MSTRPPTPQAPGWRQRLVSLTSKGKDAQNSSQSSRSSSKPRTSSTDEGYATDVESSTRRKSSSLHQSSSQQKPNIPPVPQLPPHLTAKGVAGATTPRSRHATHDAEGGYSTDASLARHRRARTVDNAKPAVPPIPARVRSESRPSAPPPAVPSSSSSVHPPCVSDSDVENVPGNSIRKSSVSALSGPRSDRDRQLQNSIPYPLNAFDDEARRLEKYMYCAAYYTNGPYRKSRYRGPSFLEHRRTNAPRRALDVGSGYGYWLRDASASWPETTFVGFDIFNLPSVAMTDEQRTRISSQQGNLLDPILPFSPGEFDYIRLANMRIAVPDAMWSSVLKKLCRLLSENGMLEVRNMPGLWTF